MKTMYIGLLSLLIVALSYVPAAAWSHANSFGGARRTATDPRATQRLGGKHVSRCR